MAPVQKKGLRALQIWCGQVTAEYDNVHIKDLSHSFRDGLAFNAIIHHFRPDLFDYKSLKPSDIRFGHPCTKNIIAFVGKNDFLGVNPFLLAALITLSDSLLKKL